MGRFEAAKEGGPVGRSVRRREDARIVTGGGRYVDDLLPEGCLHLEFVRSVDARGRLTAVDAEAARACDGVVAV
ncbi:hypothetical protein, partial [Nitratireductor sp. GCM10026969]|uniref:hypothetical protein n=1 Tax=Nitratireductor sp. GCM10026969 TaxID=3252645 RepID=UPI00360E71C7